MKLLTGNGTCKISCRQRRVIDRFHFNGAGAATVTSLIEASLNKISLIGSILSELLGMLVAENHHDLLLLNVSGNGLVGKSPLGAVCLAY